MLQGKGWTKGIAFIPMIVDSLLEAGERGEKKREEEKEGKEEKEEKEKEKKKKITRRKTRRRRTVSIVVSMWNLLKPKYKKPTKF